MFIKLCTKNTSGELVNTDNVCSIYQQGNSIRILFTGGEAYENYNFDTEKQAQKVLGELQKVLVKAII